MSLQHKKPDTWLILFNCHSCIRFWRDEHNSLQYCLQENTKKKHFDIFDHILCLRITLLCLKLHGFSVSFKDLSDCLCCLVAGFWVPQILQKCPWQKQRIRYVLNHLALYVLLNLLNDSVKVSSSDVGCWNYGTQDILSLCNHLICTVHYVTRNTILPHYLWK